MAFDLRHTTLFELRFCRRIRSNRYREPGKLHQSACAAVPFRVCPRVRLADLLTRQGSVSHVGVGVIQGGANLIGARWSLMGQTTQDTTEVQRAKQMG